VGAALLDVARHAFVEGMQVAAAISLVVAIGVAVLALVMLRDVDIDGEADAAEDEGDDAAEVRPEPARRAAFAATGAEC
jgi:hypothetical protein